MRGLLKKQLEVLFSKSDWEKEFPDFFPGSKEDIIWIMADFLKEGKYLDEAVKIVEIYKDDPDPSPEDRANERILNEEDGAITTVRGSLCWMMQYILSRLDTRYYPQIINILEELSEDRVIYVRQQVAVPLEVLAANLKAYKNKDGTDFNFSEKDRQRVHNLIFKMLRENRNHPKVLEYLAAPATRLRWLKEMEAKEALTTFFYKEDGSLNPDYVTRRFAPLAIYFAVFRKNLNDGFDNSWFKDFLNKLIENSDSDLKTTLIWHFWKTLEENGSTYKDLKEFIPTFISSGIDQEQFGQMNFLVREVVKVEPDDAINLLQTYLKIVESLTLEILTGRRKDKNFMGSRKFNIHQIWLHDIEEVVEKVARSRPEKLVEILSQLGGLLVLEIYIGNVKQIFSAYKLIDGKNKSDVETKIKKLYQELRNSNPELPELV